MTQDGTKEITSIFGTKKFSFPKPIGLIIYLIDISTIRNKNAIILDFFAGSGTTAHAVLKLNAEDDPIESKKLSETMIATYSTKYKAYQAKIRQGQIDRAMKMINDNEKKIKKNRRNPNDPARFIKKTAITANGEVAEEEYCQLDQTVIDKEAMYDGFYAVTTDIEGDVSEIIAINGRRWQIEECFRIMKTNFEARPVYLQREDRIKTHFLICFLALLIYRILELNRSCQPPADNRRITCFFNRLSYDMQIESYRFFALVYTLIH